MAQNCITYLQTSLYHQAPELTPGSNRFCFHLGMPSRRVGCLTGSECGEPRAVQCDNVPRPILYYTLPAPALCVEPQTYSVRQSHVAVLLPGDSQQPVFVEHQT